MTEKEKAEVAETPVAVYMTETERRLLRVLAARQGLSMSRMLRTLVQRELEKEGTRG